MFGKTKDPIISCSELSSIRQREEESLEEFGQRVRQLTLRAFTTARLDIFETISREAFLRGYADAAEMGLLRDPQTLNQAVQYT